MENVLPDNLKVDEGDEEVAAVSGDEGAHTEEMQDIEEGEIAEDCQIVETEDEKNEGGQIVETAEEVAAEGISPEVKTEEEKVDEKKIAEKCFEIAELTKKIAIAEKTSKLPGSKDGSQGRVRTNPIPVSNQAPPSVKSPENSDATGRSRPTKRRFDEDACAMFRQSRSCSFQMKPRRPFQSLDHNMQWFDRFGNMGNISSNNTSPNFQGRYGSHPPAVHSTRNALTPTCASLSSTCHLPLNNPRNFTQNQVVAPQLLLQAIAPTAPNPSPQHSQAPPPAPPPNISSSEALTPAQLSAALERVANPNPENSAPSSLSLARPAQHKDEFDEIREPSIAFITCKAFFYVDRFDVRVFLNSRGSDKMGRDKTNRELVVGERHFLDPAEAVQYQKVIKKTKYDEEKVVVELIYSRRIQETVAKKLGRPKKV